MMLGMPPSTFTTVHVIISLVGIGSGLIAIFGVLSAMRLNGLDRALSIDHGADQCDRLWLSLHARYARPQGRGHLAGRAGDYASGALQLSHGWEVALDLRGYGDHRRVSQCLCPGGAGFREGAGADSAGAHAVGAAISGHSAGSDGAVYRAHYFCREKIPPRRRSLISSQPGFPARIRNVSRALGARP